MLIAREPQKVLITALVNLGDVVLITAAVHVLQQAWPQCEFVGLVRPQAREVVEGNPLFSKAIINDYKSGQSSLAKDWQLTKKIEAEKFDLAICFDKRMRSYLYCRLAGIKRVIATEGVFGWVSTAAKLLVSDVVRVRKDAGTTHGAELFADLAEQICGEKTQIRVSVGSVVEEHRQHIAELLADLDTDRPLVALCVKGTFPLKDWPPQRFAQLMRLIYEKYKAILVIVGGAGDYAYGQQVIKEANVPAKNFCGETGIRDLAALLQRAALLISVCTGTVHVASTTDVPAVVIYGCTAPYRWHPLQEKYLTIWAGLDCSPCSKGVSECPNIACLDAISVNDVWLAAQSFLTNQLSEKK